MTAPRPQRLARDVAKPLPLSPEAVALLTPELTPRAYLDRLATAELTTDALRLLAAALPKAEAVWWGCRCAEAVLDSPLPLEVRAVTVAKRWAAAPTEENRLAGRDAAELAGWDSAAGCLAGAAWFAGGSLSPPGLPVVAPRDDLTAQAVAGALLLLIAHDPQRAAAVSAKFLALGRAVAAGESRPG